MLHKIFEWFYLRKRSSFGKYNHKMEIRTNDRDLIHYFHDFGGRQKILVGHIGSTEKFLN